ncbi:MAG TPA: endonuclease III [Ignavibacteria bacterium]|nr:endonuclease III [Ignavibacteria bacterium]HRJ98623.1 endonuclease III [Ignavibacteria bacterium]
MSQNTTDKSSFAAFTNLKKKFSNWDEVSKADVRIIKNEIKVCGLAETKSKEILSLLKNLKKNFGSLDLEFMNEYTDEKIYEIFLNHKGFGVKTVSCVLIFAMGRDAFPVDTHVHRILNRLGIVKTSSAEKTFEAVKEIIPEGKKYELHSNLIKFGRNICRAKNPLCSICFLYKVCEFPEKKFYRFKKINASDIKENNFIILENLS